MITGSARFAYVLGNRRSLTPRLLKQQATIEEIDAVGLGGFVLQNSSCNTEDLTWVKSSAFQR